MSAYNTHQQVFGVSLCSNILRNTRGTQATLQKDMEIQLPKVLSQVGPNWETVYGPVVWKAIPWDPLTRADNTWFVARCPALLFEDGKTYETLVVSVAATMSIFDWLVEDFEVRSVVDFVHWMTTGVLNAPVPTANPVAGKSYIANGTAKGTHTILSTLAPAGVKGAGMSLYQFILTLAAPHPTSKIIFAGHSLAGALSPSIAAAVRYTGILNWLPQNCLVYPTAGASPGNGEFASLYRSLFPITDGAGYQVWNANIANLLDAVPHAWGTSTDPDIPLTLQKLPILYGNPVAAVQDAVNYIIPLVSKFSYTPIQFRPFQSGVPFNPPKTLKEWEAIAGVEHVDAYLQFIGVQIPELKRLVTPDDQASAVDVTADAVKAVGEAAADEGEVVASDVKDDL